MMAWVESHQSLLTHRKTLAAAEFLKIDKYKFLGHLWSLWWWALDNVDADGSLSGLSDAVIDRAAGWSRKVSFCAALRKAGFIDDHGLHNWGDYAGKYILKKEQDKLQKREDRAKKSARHPKDIPRTALLEERRGEDKEEKENKEDREQQLGRIFSLYEDLFGPVNATTSRRLLELEAEHSEECVEHCFAEAVRSNGRSLKYVTSILERHALEGCPSENGGTPNRDPQIEWLERRFREGQKRKEAEV